MEVARMIIDVPGEDDTTVGWLVGADAEFTWLPSAGDRVTLPTGAMRESVTRSSGPLTLTVRRRHVRLESRSRSAPATQLFLGAPLGVDVNILRRTDGWLDHSATSEECVYAGCYKNAKRDADSALFTCVRGGHDICLACERPVVGPVRFCPYHSADEL